MKKIYVNGNEVEWKMLHIGYEDVSKIDNDGTVITGLTCVYSVPGELGGSLKPGEKTLCIEGMSFTIMYTGNA